MDTLPIGPRFLGNSNGDLPLYPGGNTSEDRSAYTQKVLRWRDSAREEAYETANMNPEMKNFQKYINALQGDFWGKNRARYKSRFYDNRIEKARIDDLALLTDTRPTIDVSTKVEAYKEQSNIVQNVMHYEWMRGDIDLSLVSVADITKLFGTGFWKIGGMSPGRLEVLPCGPENVMPIQPGFNLQSSTAVMYRNWKSVASLKRRFPYTSEGLERENAPLDPMQSGSVQYNRPNYIDEYIWNGMAPAFRRIVGVRERTADVGRQPLFKSLEAQEFYVDDPSVNESKRDVLMRHPTISLQGHNWWYWVKPGEMLYPRKRLMVFGGNKILYDGPSTFWHGLYPFACMRLNPVPWSFWGLSKYRDLLPINHAINEIVAGILDMVRRALNPTAIAKANSIPPASWKDFYPDMPGQKLLMGGLSQIGDLRYMDPPNIPPYVFNLLTALMAEFDRLAGSMDVGAMSKKKQVPGGDTVEQMRDLMSTATRLEGRFMEAFLRDAGVQALSNVFQFYEMPVRLKVLGGDGVSWEDFQHNGPNLIPEDVPREDHWRNFAMMVSPGSLHGGAKDRKRAEALTAFKMGAISLQALHRAWDMADSKQIIDELKQEHEQGLGASGGRTPRMTRGQRNGQPV